MVRLSFWLFVVIFFISETVEADRSKRDEDRLRFSGPRQPEEAAEYRLNHRRRPQNSGDGSYIENVFKIPIAVIKGTSAAAQAFSPQNTDTINKIFDIPVVTLDAVGNFIKESRPQRLDNNNDDETVQRPIRPANDNRDERRRRLLQEREEERRRREERRRLIEDERQRREERRRFIEDERQRRRIKDQEKFFHLGNYPTLNFAYGLTDLLLGGNGHGGFFGGHGHGHGSHGSHGSHGKPPHRPLKPLKPSKPGNHGSHGGNHQSGNEGYEVNEEIDEEPVNSGIFSWLQPSTQSDDNRIQNKIAPGAENRYNRDRPEFRYS